MEKTRLILGAGAVTGTVLLVVLAVFDPTRVDGKRLDAVATAANEAPRLAAFAKAAAYAGDLDGLVQRPIFAMTTGAGAYAEKTFQLFGVSISPDRKAALVAIDGAAPAWVRAGQVSSDVQLIDVSAGSARFDTPLGERTVNLSDTPPVASPAENTGG